jgi:hypothetical protein
VKSLTHVIILASAAGAFLSGLILWMANSSYQQAEQLRQHGRYCDVQIIQLYSSCPDDDGTTFWYVDIQPVGASADPHRITCSVVASTYNELRSGQHLKAWILGPDALLDYSPKNARFVAGNILIILLGCGIVMLAAIAAKIIEWKGMHHEEIA